MDIKLLITITLTIALATSFPITSMDVTAAELKQLQANDTASKTLAKYKVTKALQPLFKEKKYEITIDIGDIDYKGVYPDTTVQKHGCHAGSPWVFANNNHYEGHIKNDSYFNASLDLKWNNVTAVMNGYFDGILSVTSDIKVEEKQEIIHC